MKYLAIQSNITILLYYNNITIIQSNIKINVKLLTFEDYTLLLNLILHFKLKYIKIYEIAYKELSIEGQ